VCVEKGIGKEEKEEKNERGRKRQQRRSGTGEGEGARKASVPCFCSYFLIS
jgi:hypothetical protein